MLKYSPLDENSIKQSSIVDVIINSIDKICFVKWILNGQKVYKNVVQKSADLLQKKGQNTHFVLSSYMNDSFLCKWNMLLSWRNFVLITFCSTLQRKKH